MLSLFLLGLDALFLVVFAAFGLLLPSITRRDLLFGVTVPPGTRSTPEGRAILRRYRLGIVALSLVLAIVLALLWRLAPSSWWASPWMALLPVVFALSPDIPYLRGYRSARRLAASSAVLSVSSRTSAAAELVPRRYSDYVPWVWETLPLAMIALTISYLATAYAAAPAIIPTHFNFAGVADAYTQKSIGSFFSRVWVQLFIEVFLTVIAVLVVGAKAVPGGADQRFRRRMLRYLFFVKALTIAFLGVLTVFIAQASLTANPQAGLPIAMSAVFVLLVLGSAFALGITTGQGGARLGPAAETATDRMDDRYWKLGALYVNREDPSIFVERRFGLGWTLNFGNPRAVFVLVGLLVVPLGVVAGIIAISSPR